MNEQQSSHFSIGDDKESPDALFQAEISEQRIDRLSHRLTLFSILIPCLVCILLFVGYLDVKKRFINVQGSGEKEIQNLSKHLESNYSSLASQVEKLEASLKSKVSGIETAVDSLKKEFNKMNSALGNAIKSVQSDKVGKKELAEAVATMDKNLTPLREDLKKSASSMSILEAQTKQELTNLVSATTRLTTEIQKIQTQILSVSTDRIDRKTLDLALKAEQQSFQQKLNQISNNFETQITFAQKKISELEKLLRMYREKPGENAGASVSRQPQGETPALPEEPATPPPLLQPGKIIEQDIQ